MFEIGTLIASIFSFAFILLIIFSIVIFIKGRIERRRQLDEISRKLDLLLEKVSGH